MTAEDQAKLTKLSDTPLCDMALEDMIWFRANVAYSATTDLWLLQNIRSRKTILGVQ